jgi:hypothetical protein
MFADIPTLLESSRPQPRMAWFLYAAAGSVLLVLAMNLFSDGSAESQQMVETLSSCIIVAMLAAITINNYLQVRAGRAEHARLEAAEELVQLRRWPQAAMLLQGIMSRPTRTPQARVQALVYFTNVLARYHRFEDVIAIDDHLLQTIPLDGPAVHVLKVSRGMALLREDRLFDADRAISDLRRMDQAADSAGLAVLELYRDVKTGHPNEAIELFSQKREVIRRQMGHRLGDALVLVAMAHELLNETEAARAAYESATLLVPPGELHRRYPETATLAGKYPATPVPEGLA